MKSHDQTLKIEITIDPVKGRSGRRRSAPGPRRRIRRASHESHA